MLTISLIVQDQGEGDLTVDLLTSWWSCSFENTSHSKSCHMNKAQMWINVLYNILKVLFRKQLVKSNTRVKIDWRYVKMLMLWTSWVKVFLILCTNSLPESSLCNLFKGRFAAVALSPSWIIFVDYWLMGKTTGIALMNCYWTDWIPSWKKNSLDWPTRRPFILWQHTSSFLCCCGHAVDWHVLFFWFGPLELVPLPQNEKITGVLFGKDQ